MALQNLQFWPLHMCVQLCRFDGNFSAILFIMWSPSVFINHVANPKFIYIDSSILLLHLNSAKYIWYIDLLISLSYYDSSKCIRYVGIILFDEPVFKPL
jgi:hypothetical protein